ncbi:FUSC family protein [Martelella alba]|uniref:Fusaric acid resistance family protein n=1 Tax=Martelella alba TaxID=2590451 RepID=A0ABY2SF66_9HYPH|nr:FUSC family protein [Martelella alba]TKI03514.1 hypothetical protein FCN80_21315 [Martelella alba]
MNKNQHVGLSADFAIGTTLAAAGSMLCATWLGFHYPWWAAMTVWLVAQPTRGLMLERMIARFAGSTVGALVLSGSLWLFTGWQTGPIMVMTAVLFASLFSSNPRGNTALADVLLGTFTGALAGCLFRLWISPRLSHDAGMLAVILFLMVGAYLMACPRTGKMAIDINMTFLLVTQPFSSSLSASPSSVLMQGAARCHPVLLSQ